MALLFTLYLLNNYLSNTEFVNFGLHAGRIGVRCVSMYLPMGYPTPLRKFWREWLDH